MSEQQEKDVVNETNLQQSNQNKKKIQFDKVILIVLLVGLVIVSALYANEKGTFDRLFSSKSSNKNAAVIDLYVMSQCPYGVQAENAIKPIVDKFKKNVVLNINYIADEDGNGGFSSLHGEQEVKGNIVQLCAKKYDASKYLDMIICQNKDYANVATNWESCAKEVKLSNIDKVKACYEGQEGKDLLKENIKLAQQVGAQGSPTYYINGQQYQGGRDEGSITKEICKTNTNLSICKDLPVCFTDSDCSDNPVKVGACANGGTKDAKCNYSDPKPVSLTVLNDKRCPDCVAIEPQITDSLRQIFKGLQIKTLDYSDAEGKQLYPSLDGIRLPAYLFGENVKDGEGYSNVQPYLSAVAGYQSLAVGSQFDPTKEICDNKIDDNGNKKIDCADSECSGATVCRKEISKRLDVFVMSDCPYGNIAEDAMKEVVANFGKNIDFHVNYIASKNSDGTFNSLHGEYEVQQNKVELCVNQYHPTKNLDFIMCMNAKGIKDSDWKECSNQLGLNTTKINTCATGSEGTYLLTQNIKIAEQLGIGASPTWLVNNKYQDSGLDSETIKNLFCKYNPGTAGCEKTLTSNSDAQAASAAGAGCQ